MTLSGAEGSGANWLGSLHCGRDDRLRQSALQVKAVGITKNHVILRERSEPKDLLQYCSLTFRKQHPEDHSPGIAGRANTSNFASERHQKIVTTIIKSNPGKPFSENATVNKTAETSLDVPRNTVAFGLRLRQPASGMLLYQLVGHGSLGTPGLVDLRHCIRNGSDWGK